MSLDFLKLSAFELAEKIKSGQITSVAATQFYIDQQKKWNPRINAIAEDQWEQALLIAQKKDQIQSETPELAQGSLWGVPFTCKEMWAIEGLKNTLGSVHRQNHRANFTSTVAQKILEAGAILLATTNVPELGFWFECENTIYGSTKNPYDVTRTSGGSSGGEGAIIGAGASPFGLGTDVGGSIRLPAGFCGVYGHKPSHFLVSMVGHVPMTPENAADFDMKNYPLTVGGPMARTAKDLRPLLEVMMGKDNLDTQVQNKKIKAPVSDWTDKTVWTIEDPIMSQVSRATEPVRDAVKMAGQYFESMGATVKKMNPRIFIDAFALWSSAMAQIQSASFQSYLFGGTSPSLLKEFIENFRGQGDYTFPALGTAVLEKFSSGAPDSRYETLRLKLIKQLNQLLGEDSILIFPLHPRVAPPLRSTFNRPFDLCYTGIFNALRLPASAGPVFHFDGLPVGVQIVAGHDQDHLCLSGIELIESAFAGWKEPEA